MTTTTTINPEILAQRLEHAARVYDTDRQTALDCGHPGLAETFLKQASEARAWADAIRNADSIAIDDEGDIRVKAHA